MSLLEVWIAGAAFHAAYIAFRVPPDYRSAGELAGAALIVVLWPVALLLVIIIAVRVALKGKLA